MARRLVVIAAAAEGDDGRMLEEEELIVDLVALAHLDQLLLELHAVFVGDEVQAMDLATAHSRCTT